MPNQRTYAQISEVRQELLDLLDEMIAHKANDEEREALADTIDDLTNVLWNMDRAANEQ